MPNGQKNSKAINTEDLLSYHFRFSCGGEGGGDGGDCCGCGGCCCTLISFSSGFSIPKNYHSHKNLTSIDFSPAMPYREI